MDSNNDALRCKFTAWMKVVVKRAKIDYIRRLGRHSNDIPIEDEQLKDKLIYEPVGEVEITDGFAFDNAKLSSIFMQLPPKRRRILELLFVHNMEPEEIAIELQCSLQHVYNMRSLAINELKQKLKG